MDNIDDWSLPPELSTLGPRVINPSKAYRIRLLSQIGLFVAAAFVIACFASWTAFRMSELQTRGQTASAIIERLYTTTHRSVTDWHVDYKYESADQRNFEGSATVTPWTYRQLLVGERLKVRYLPRDESISTPEITLHDTWKTPWLRLRLELTACVLISGFAVLIVTVYWKLRFRRERLLIERGVAAPANIHTQIRVRGLSTRPWRIDFEFQDQSGMTVISRERRATQWLAQNGRPTVLYEPNYPHRNLIYPALLVQIPHQESLHDGKQ